MKEYLLRQDLKGKLNAYIARFPMRFTNLNADYFLYSELQKNWLQYRVKSFLRQM